MRTKSWLDKNPNKVHPRTKAIQELTWQVSQHDLTNVAPFNIAFQFEKMTSECIKLYMDLYPKANVQSIKTLKDFIEVEAFGDRCRNEVETVINLMALTLEARQRIIQVVPEWANDRHLKVGLKAAAAAATKDKKDKLQEQK